MADWMILGWDLPAHLQGWQEKATQKKVTSKAWGAAPVDAGHEFTATGQPPKL